MKSVNRRWSCVVLAQVSLLMSCAGATESGPPLPARLLFLGSSLTYVNDLPGMVKALADSAGMPGVIVEQVAKPGYALEDHWYDGQSRNALAGSAWDYVILQQGPSALPESRAHLRQWTAAESYRLASLDVDGLHPSLRGTYVAALTIFGSLYRRSVVGLPQGLDVLPEPFELPAHDARILQQAADEVNGYPRSR